MKRICVLFILMSIGVKAQDDNLANLLIEIGDSVKQATLSPFEVYNKKKPYERSYLGFSQSIYTDDNEQFLGPNRFELFHIIGIYANMPRQIGSGLEVNTSIEEINNSESIALLQGATYAKSELLDSVDQYFVNDFGILLAAGKENPFTKNLFISLGIVNSRKQVFKSYSNNGLLDISDEFVVRENQIVSYGMDLGLRYVLPYFQLGFGYRSALSRSGFYGSVGLNIPVKVILSHKEKAIFRDWKKIDRDAKNYKNRNF